MKPGLRVLAAAGAAFLAAMTATDAAFAQKSGGILRVHALDSPPSLSMHDEVDANPARAAMGIFNNLVMFDQHTKQNNMRSIIPDLATTWRDGAWRADSTAHLSPKDRAIRRRSRRSLQISAYRVACSR